MRAELVSYSDTVDKYTVQLYRHSISTTVTATATAVDEWISDIYRIHRRRLPHLIVGLDVEWRPRFKAGCNPAATLQLCVGSRCLIFQLLYADSIPKSLAEFLLQPDFTFVGVGVEEDVEKLLEDYELSVGQSLDLRSLAAEELGIRELKQAGLKRLAAQVLGIEVNKPRRITMSAWDAEMLNSDQVQYACIDAFLSFEIGRTLIKRN